MKTRAANGMAAPDGTFLDFGGKGAALLFLHANGYPPACYRPLLATLEAKYHVLAAPLRPLWPGADPQDLHDWRILSTDLARSMEQQLVAPTVVAGHSMGATVALRTALHHPELFSGLILMDPVIIPPAAMLAWTAARRLGIGSRLRALIRSARRRRKAFGNLETAFQSYRAKAVFRHVSDENLRVCVLGMLQRSQNGDYSLIYPPAWEARVYYTAIWKDWDLWQHIGDLRIPTLILRGSKSDTFWRSTARAIMKRNSGIRIAEVEEASHLAPLERPEQMAHTSVAFLEEQAEHGWRGGRGERHRTGVGAFENGRI